MKTSNKILLSALILLFATPLVMAIVLNKKIRNGDYITRSTAPLRREIANDCPVLRLSGTNLYCYLVVDDSSYLEYERTDKDRIRMFVHGDTVDIAVNHASDSMDTRYDKIRINLHLRRPETVIIKTSSIMLLHHGFFKQHNLEVFLSDQASFIMIPGRIRDWRYDDHGYYVRDYDSEKNTPMSIYKRLAINAKSSSVVIHEKILVDELAMHSTGSSELKINTDASINTVSGFISDSTAIESSWRNLRKFKP